MFQGVFSEVNSVIKKIEKQPETPELHKIFKKKTFSK